MGGADKTEQMAFLAEGAEMAEEAEAGGMPGISLTWFRLAIAIFTNTSPTEDQGTLEVTEVWEAQVAMEVVAETVAME
jgi:hypothetical protein